MEKNSFQNEWSLLRNFVAMAFDRRTCGRRNSTGAMSLGPQSMIGRRNSDRRRLLNIALLCVPSLFITKAYAGEAVKFEASSAFTSESVTLRADISKPEGNGPFPAVVLMHGCGGWQPPVRYTMNTYADYLVSHGFVVLNLDSFGPRNNGGGTVCESTKRLTDALDYRTYDAYDALKYLQNQKFVDSSNIFLMGQSNGGSVAINVAKGDAPQGKKGKDESFRAVVAYYPWCGSFGNRKVELALPLLVFGGGQDDWVPTRECEAVQSTGAELQVKIYPEAAHSFDLEIMPQRYLGKLVGKNDYAAEDSRGRMLAFFIEHTTSYIQKTAHLAKN
jgi:dienelactone hydrolase